MKLRQATRGRPVIALAAILCSWVGARAALWDASAIETPTPFEIASSGVGSGAASEEITTGHYSEGQGPAMMSVPVADMLPPMPAPGPQWREEAEYGYFPGIADVRAPRQIIVRHVWPEAGGPQYHAVPYPVSFGRVSGGPPRVAEPDQPVRVAAAHQMMWMSALSRVPLPMSLATSFEESVPAPFYPAGRESARGKRWSGDAWMLLRRGGAPSLGTGVAPSTYGASQAGGVLRYRLVPSSRHRPAAYARMTAAMNGVDEREAALGISARPVPGLPVVLAAEVRATNQLGKTEIRPAAMAVTEFAPFALPAGARGEAYLQAGYVGGKFSTPFVDGQVRADRKVVKLGNSEVRAGAGAWGGAQKGASRLDVGPTANVGLGLGGSSSARVG
ncbi:MAG: hypothetical protein KDE55_05220, partial [Novosphingobium sp.]|nr:hypothetical protein [Novosphingobium sp.]